MDRHLKIPVAGAIKQGFSIGSANYVELLAALLHFTNHLNHYELPNRLEIALCNCGSLRIPPVTIKSTVIYTDTRSGGLLVTV